MNSEEYEKLISDRNARREKFMGYVRAILSLGIGVASPVESMDMAFDISNAAGDQLDVIGDLVGLKRLLDYEPSVGSREMDDDEYRLCLKMTIAKNEWDGTNDGAFAAYKILNDSGIGINYYDNQDTTVSLVVQEALSVRIYEILRNTGLLLVPSGVSAEFEFSGESVDFDLYTTVGISGIESVECVIAETED